MTFLRNIWIKLSQSKAIDRAGPLETSFFASVYRLVFVIGASITNEDFQYTVYCFTVRILCALLFYLEVSHAVTENLSVDDFISAANVISIHFITIWKLLAMGSNRKIFEKLAKALELPSFDISTQGRKNIVEYWANRHKKYLKRLLTLTYLTLGFWLLYPLLDEEDYNLVVELKVPFKYNSPFLYMLTYLASGIVFSYASLTVLITDVIMQVHLILLSCQFDVLSDCFENAFEECAVEFQDIERHELVKNNAFIDKYIKRLGDLVKQHQAILAQTMDLKSILSAPMLGQLACSGSLICLVGYQATTSMTENVAKFAMSLLYIGFIMTTLFIICRWCEEITFQSQRIGQSAYFSLWESGISQAPGVRATLMLVIVRSNKPLRFLAGGMYILSLSAYANLVKASYSALNILLTSRTRHE